MEQRDRSWLRNSINYSSDYAIRRMKDSTGLRNVVQSAACRNTDLLHCEKINAIGQLLQIVAIAELFVVKDAEPKVRGVNLSLV